MGKKGKGKKGKDKGSKDQEKDKQKLQAIITAEFFPDQFYPMTRDIPQV